MPPAGRVPGCSRPRRGPLFHQATPTSTAAAPGSNEGANMRQQGCSCFHLSRANSWARVPGQQHYKFCNKCRLNIAREAKGRAVPGHLCSLDSWAGSLDAHGRGAGRSSIRQHQPAPPRLFHPPGSNEQHHQAGGFLDAHGLGAGRSSIRRHTPGGRLLQVPSTRPRRGRCSLPGCWGQHYQAAARAALLSGDNNQHRRGSSILQDPTRATGLQPLSFIQGLQLAP